MEDEEEFSQWLYKRWEEKDCLMEEFYKTGRFPSRQEEEGVVASFPVKGRNYVPLILCWIGAWPMCTLVRAVVGGWFGW